MNKNDRIVINGLIGTIFGDDCGFPVLTNDIVKRLAWHFKNHCPVCGSRMDPHYKEKYGMCMGCYAYMVCADGVSICHPDHENVIKGIEKALIAGYGSQNKEWIESEVDDEIYTMPQ